MQMPQKRGEQTALAIISFLGGVLIARGVTAMVTRHYAGTARFSGNYDLYGDAALYQGAAWVCLGMMIFSTLGLQLKLPRQPCLGVAALFLCAAIGCFVLSARG